MANMSFIAAAKLVELLATADAQRNMYVRMLDTDRLAIGVDPFRPTQVIDFSKEQIGPWAPGELNAVSQQYNVSSPASAPVDNIEGPRITRRTGAYWFEIAGRRVECSSLKDLLAEGLRALEGACPGTFEKLSLMKPRSRRIVARDPKDLFDKGHLTQRYAERLVDGWWYGTNNSNPETNTWLQRACSCSGLKWDEDFKTSLTITVDDI
jgi:hypothetical protein